MVRAILVSYVWRCVSSIDEKVWPSTLWLPAMSSSDAMMVRMKLVIIVTF